MYKLIRSDFASIQKLEHEVKLLFRLETVVEINKEGMMDVGLQDVALRHHVFDLTNIEIMVESKEKQYRSIFFQQKATSFHFNHRKLYL